MAGIKHKGLLLAGLLIAMLFAALDNTIMSTALPRIVGEFQGMDWMTWVTTIYMLTATVVVPITGKLADRIGRRTVYLSGIFLFMIGSILCGMSQSITELIIFRGIQGIGGGVMMPMAMIIIGDLFTGRERAKWQGAFGAVFGLASVVGPKIGGWFVDHLDWRWVFYINLPVGIIAAIFIGIALVKQTEYRKQKMDYLGMLTLIGTVVPFLIALTIGGHDFAWLSFEIMGLFGLSIASLITFLIVEKHAEDPILPLHYFQHSIFRSISLTGFLMAIGMFGTIMFIPFFLQGALGMSASDSGSAMTPMMLAMIVTSILGGRMVYRIGIKYQIIIGMFIICIAFLTMTGLDLQSNAWQVYRDMIVLGMGIGFVMPTLTIALQESFTRTELGVVTASTQFFRQIGGTVGMTVLGAAMNQQANESLTLHLTPMIQSTNLANSQEWLNWIDRNPMNFFTMIFNPTYLANLPNSVLEKMLPIVKDSLVLSLNTVFWLGFAVMIIGLLITFTIPRIPIQDRKESTLDVKDADETKHEFPVA